MQRFLFQRTLSEFYIKNTMRNGKYILVAGLGKSGTSIAKFLKSQGENIIATDSDPLKIEIAEELEHIGIKTEIGFHRAQTFENAEKIIVSPGIPLNNNFLAMARKKGIPITGELDLAEEFIDIPVIAITGTNGKTTVTTLISEMLKASGFKVFKGGNIGVPLMDYLMRDEKADIMVAEVSSFQLDTAGRFSPDVAVLLNITEDHINRYKDFSAYSDSKWSIFKNQTYDNLAIINSAIQDVEKRCKNITSIPVLFGGNNISTADLKPYRIWQEDSVIDISGAGLKGNHNRENIAAACLACLALGGSISAIERTVNSFKGLPHRIEYAGTINGVDYIDDSKGTNPDAVVKALECCGNNIILILGGRSKNTQFSYMAEAIKHRVKTIIALGESKEEIKKDLSGICRIMDADSMEQAVDIAYDIALSGDTVLLSPACASFDMYESYSARGDDFVLKVKLKSETFFKKTDRPHGS